MEIKILGPGCANCKHLYKITSEAVTQLNIEATVTKVEDITEIMKYGIVKTPAIVIDGEVVVKGRVPTEKEIKALINK